MKDRILLPSDVQKILISSSPFYLLIVFPSSLNFKEIMENIFHKIITINMRMHENDLR